MTDTKQTERQKRYYARKKAQAMAVFAHATEIELAWFGINRDGEHIAIGYDGKPIELVVRADATLPDLPRPEDAPVEPAKPAKVYAPVSWSAGEWNSTVDAIQERKLARQGVLDELAAGTRISDKQKRQAIKVIESLPDAPDWYAHLPRAEET